MSDSQNGTFIDKQTRFQLFALVYNLGNFLRRLAPPVAGVPLERLQ